MEFAARADLRDSEAGLSDAPSILEAILASIRSDLKAVSYVDLTTQRRAEAWIQANVPGASSVRPYDLTVCERARQDEAFAGAAPTALVLVQQPRSRQAPLPRYPGRGCRDRAGLRGPRQSHGVGALRQAPSPSSRPGRVEPGGPVPRSGAGALWRLLTALAGDDESAEVGADRRQPRLLR